MHFEMPSKERCNLQVESGYALGNLSNSLLTRMGHLALLRQALQEHQLQLNSGMQLFNPIIEAARAQRPIHVQEEG